VLKAVYVITIMNGCKYATIYKQAYADIISNRGKQAVGAWKHGT
jgi:hypothetical protein